MDQYVFYRNKPKEEIKHSEEDLDESVIDEFLAMSDDEFENCIKHTFDEDDLNYIAHYGVKGMKWGVINEDDPTGGGGIKAKISNLKDRLANVIQKLTGKTVRTDNGSENTEDKSVEDKLNKQKDEQVDAAIKKVAKDRDDPVLLNLSKEAQKKYLDKEDPNWDKPNNAAAIAAGPKNQNKITERNIEDTTIKREPGLATNNLNNRKHIETDLNRKEGTATAEQLKKTAKEMPKYKYTEQSNKDYNHDLGNKLLSNIKENNPDRSLYENAIKVAEKSEMNFRLDSRTLSGKEDYNALNKKSEKKFNEWIEDYVKQEKLKIHNATVTGAVKNKTKAATNAKAAVAGAVENKTKAATNANDTIEESRHEKDSKLEELKKKSSKPKLSHSELVENARNSLKHWGIIGQRWGVRNYQDEYGRLTEAGKLRYGKNKDTPDAIAAIKRGEDAAEEAVISGTSGAFKQTGDLFKKKGNYKNPYKTQYKKSKYSKMSDAELNARINRLKKEEEYANLVGDNKYVKSGQEKARETLQTVGSIIAIGGTVATIAGTVRSIKEGYTRNK